VTDGARIEQALLCLALTRWDAPGVREAMDSLTPGMWSSDHCRIVYRAIMGIHGEGGTPDVTLTLGRLDPIHTDTLCEILSSTAPAEGHAATYAREIRTRAVVQTSLRTFRAAADDLEAAPHDAGPALRVERMLPRITADAVSEQDIEAQYTESIDEARRLRAEAYDGRPAGIPTGFTGLDSIIGGWQTGLHVVAGRRSSGKSSFLVSSLIAAGRARKRVRFVSLDMPRLIYHYRVASHLSMVPVSRYVYRHQDEYEAARLVEAQQFLLGSGCYFAERERDAREILRAARATAADWDLLFFDFLQATRGKGSLYERMTDLAFALKALALDTDRPVVALCQVPNPSDARKRDPKIPRSPTLNELKGSGDIADAALTVIFPYRADVDHYGGGADGPAELIVGKSQNTRTGRVQVEWCGKQLEYRETGSQEPLPF
jgi:replicative DNA helicase